MNVTLQAEIWFSVIGNPGTDLTGRRGRKPDVFLIVPVRFHVPSLLSPADLPISKRVLSYRLCLPLTWGAGAPSGTGIPKPPPVPSGRRVVKHESLAHPSPEASCPPRLAMRGEMGPGWRRRGQELDLYPRSHRKPRACWTRGWPDPMCWAEGGRRGGLPVDTATACTRAVAKGGRI